MPNVKSKITPKSIIQSCISVERMKNFDKEKDGSLTNDLGSNDNWVKRETVKNATKGKNI